MAAKIGCLVMDFKFHPWGLLCYVNNFNDQERILTTGNICSLHIKYALMMREFLFVIYTTRFIVVKKSLLLRIRITIISYNYGGLSIYHYSRYRTKNPFEFIYQRKK